VPSAIKPFTQETGTMHIQFGQQQTIQQSVDSHLLKARNYASSNPFPIPENQQTVLSLIDAVEALNKHVGNLRHTQFGSSKSWLA
jgi:hypothetical protein